MVTDSSAPYRLLILSCSQRKRPDEQLLPALERYDGPAFRVLRRFLREKPSEAPDVLILSAEHGLISQDTPIAVYDRKMTPARAHELRPLVLTDLNRLTNSRLSSEILVFAGKQYLPALIADDASPLSRATVRVCAGALGRKLADLHDWLHGGPPELRYNSTMLVEGNTARIRGVELTLTPEQVMDVAKEALAKQQGCPERYESWYVELDERCVAPKWLVSQLTSMPVGSFHSEDARRVLQQLGLKVRRV
jgi:uncharacterized protein DUF6884